MWRPPLVWLFISSVVQKLDDGASEGLGTGIGRPCQESLRAGHDDGHAESSGRWPGNSCFECGGGQVHDYFSISYGRTTLAGNRKFSLSCCMWRARVSIAEIPGHCPHPQEGAAESGAKRGLYVPTGL